MDWGVFQIWFTNIATVIMTDIVGSDKKKGQKMPAVYNSREFNQIFRKHVVSNSHGFPRLPMTLSSRLYARVTVPLSEDSPRFVFNAYLKKKKTPSQLLDRQARIFVVCWPPAEKSS